MRFVHRPTPVEAAQFHGLDRVFPESSLLNLICACPHPLTEHEGDCDTACFRDATPHLHTPIGVADLEPRDWIVQGAGGIYPVSEDNFWKNYEPETYPDGVA